MFSEKHGILDGIMSLLFDIDGTLLFARGVGRPAFAAAIEAVFNRAYPGIDTISFVGATDSGVIRQIAAEMGITPTTAQIERFYLCLAATLDAAMSKRPPEVFSGVRHLLEALRDSGEVLGLMTGNIRATAWSKVHHAALSDFFVFGGYGDKEPERVAIVQQAQAEALRLGSPARLLIGDAPADVEAGHAAGMPVLAVATGWVDAQTLVAAGADAVLENLDDTLNVLQTIAALTRSRE